MTTQQKTDLKLWKQDQSQPLPESLKNVLLEDCLEELKNGEARKNLNSLQEKTLLVIRPNLDLACEGGVFGFNFALSESNPSQNLRIAIIQTLLSRTPDGQAVMPFLDVDMRFVHDDGAVYKLDNWLYREFTEALRVGKTFEEALEIINLIYCQNI